MDSGYTSSWAPGSSSSTEDAVDTMRDGLGDENMSSKSDRSGQEHQFYFDVNGVLRVEIQGTRIWQGYLKVKGGRAEIVVPCVAIQYVTPCRPTVLSATSWPSRIECYASKLKKLAEVLRYVNDPTSQWFVRIASVDERQKESRNQRLSLLLEMMQERDLGFEIECKEDAASQGTLYLWSSSMRPFGVSLLGIFRPIQINGESVPS